MISPVILYGVVWAVVALLYTLSLSEMLQPIKIETIYLVSFSWLCLLAGWLIASIYTKMINIKPVSREAYFTYFQCRKREFRLYLLLVIWLVATVAEVFVYKNLPLLSAFGIGPPLRYTEFGFPGIHGLLNATYFCLSVFFFIKAFVTKRAIYWSIFLILLLWPFLALSRMMIIAIIVQVLFASLILSKSRRDIKKYIQYALLLMVVVLVFGYLGDVRNGREHLLGLAQLTFEYPDWLPSGFAWVYLYVVTPINNLNYAVDYFPNVSELPIEVVSRIFPSFIRTELFLLLDKETEVYLVASAFNISTLFLPLIQDFGFLFAPVVFIFIGFVINFLVYKALYNPRYLLFWVVFLYSIVISVFSNHMFHLVFFFEACLGYFVYGARKI
jgi:oligosaccharide repeat unit polymerase